VFFDDPVEWLDRADSDFGFAKAAFDLLRFFA